MKILFHNDWIIFDFRQIIQHVYRYYDPTFIKKKKYE